MRSVDEGVSISPNDTAKFGMIYPGVKISAGKSAVCKTFTNNTNAPGKCGRVVPKHKNLQCNLIYAFADNTIIQEELSIYEYHICTP